MRAIATRMSHGHGGMTLTRCQKKEPLSHKSGNGRLWKSEVTVKCVFFFFCDARVSHFLYCPHYRSSAGGGKKGGDRVCVCVWIGGREGAF